MSNTAPILAISSDVAPSLPAQSIPPVQPAPNATLNLAASQTSDAQIEEPADLRLVIEEDKAAGSYVYKTVDPRTGKVISQVPREQLLRMRDDASYTPGSIVDTHG